MTLDPDPRSVEYPDAALMPSPDYIAGYHAGFEDASELAGTGAVVVVVAVAVVLALAAVVAGLGLWRWRG